jgi:hypothetical protein
MYTGENQSMRAKERRQKFNSALGTIFRISKCSQLSKSKLLINFYLEQGRLKIEKPIAISRQIFIR